MAGKNGGALSTLMTKDELSGGRRCAKARQSRVYEQFGERHDSGDELAGKSGLDGGRVEIGKEENGVWLGLITARSTWARLLITA